MGSTLGPELSALVSGVHFVTSCLRVLSGLQLSLSGLSFLVCKIDSPTGLAHLPEGGQAEPQMEAQVLWRLARAIHTSPQVARSPPPSTQNHLTGRSRSTSLDGGPVKALSLPKGSSGPNWICGPFRNSPNLDSGFLGCPLPIPFHLDGLKLAQASSFYSRLLSAAKTWRRLGVGQEGGESVITELKWAFLGGALH